MAIPDPATTEWVPIWHPTSEGPVGPAGPTGPTGPAGPEGPAGVAGPHHAQHETGGSDEVLFPSGIKERGRSVAMGEWIDIPFNAANFVGFGGMTWTVAAGNVLTNAYALVGKTMYWSLFLAGTTLGGTPSSQLFVTAPFTFSARYQIFKPGRASINDLARSMEVGKSGGNQIFIVMDDDTAFPALGSFRLDFAGFFDIA
jgi:hypothetical protein